MESTGSLKKIGLTVGCGSPPQEHVTGGMQSNVQRLKIQDQACYLPKMCSHGQGMVHVSFLCLVYMFVCFHPALTDLLFQGILLQMSLQRPSWSRATITRGDKKHLVEVVKVIDAYKVYASSLLRG